MSRGVRDLRDMICISRLTCHESEEDKTFSNKDHKELTMSCVSSECTALYCDSSKSCQPDTQIISPDSGFITSESPGNHLVDSHSSFDNSLTEDGCSISSNECTSGSNSGVDISKSAKPQKKRRKKKNVSLNYSAPGQPQSPSLQSSVNAINKMGTNNSITTVEFTLNFDSDKTEARSNFDEILPYMDAALVANWLSRSNVAIQELSKYCNQGDNFVQFCHFWLSEFAHSQKIDILTLEYDILLDEVSLTLAVGRESKKVVRKDILDLCKAVFHEYPHKLLDFNKPYVFIDYLDILTCKKHSEYKKLLSNVHCSTKNRQYVQWLLASRSFAFFNMWSSVVNFYRNLTGEGRLQGLPVSDLCSYEKIIPNKRMLQAIRLGYTDVINYLITAGHVSPSYTDSHRRSLLFIAVMHGQTEAVRYFLTLDSTSTAINQPADTGNTCLHAASNNGNLAIVELLCQCQDINVNYLNAQCDSATPLHLAVIHGHVKVVECLLKHGADASLKMGLTTVADLARDFDHREILALLT